jgi:hypothetical protein
MHASSLISLLLAGLLAGASTNILAAPEVDEADDAATAPKKAKPARKGKAKDTSPQFKIDQAKVEGGGFLDNAAPSGQFYGHLVTSVNWQPSREWELQLAARIDGEYQTAPNADRLRAYSDESYIRWRGEGVRITAGTQYLLWGRTDEIPPTDRLARVDLTRLNLDPLADRRLAVPALRVEKFLSDYKLDAIWVADYQPAELPPWESVWHPVDRTRGRIIGVNPDPLLTYLVQNGSFAEDRHGSAGGGARLTRSGGAFDWGVSLQRVRQSTPYYQINQGYAANLIAAGGNPVLALANTQGPTFTAVHPMSTIAGGELEFQAKGATWRLEATYSGDAPATTQDLRYILVPATDAVAGVELFPGDADTRLTMQLASHHLSTSESIIDRKDFVAFTGELEHPFASDRWRFNLRTLLGINHRDNYVNPKLTYRGFEPHEIYLAGHFYGGDDQGLGGFHRDHDLLVLGWQVRY